MDNGPPSQLFSLPPEMLEKIFVLLPSTSLVALLTAVGSSTNFHHFRQKLQEVLRNVAAFDSLRAIYPASIGAIQRHFSGCLRYPRDGEGARRVIDAFEALLRDGTHERREITVDVEPEHAESPRSYIYDDAWDQLARVTIGPNRQTMVDVWDRDFQHVRRVPIGPLATPRSVALFRSHVAWIERDGNATYGFLHLKMKNVFRPTEAAMSVPISKHGRKKSYGVSRILTSFRFFVVHDETKFLVHAFPSLAFVFWRKAQILDAALDGDFLYVVSRGQVTTWDLVKKRILKTTDLPAFFVTGSQRLRFPYLFFKVESFQGQPDRWHWIAMNASADSLPKRTGFDVDALGHRLQGSGDFFPVDEGGPKRFGILCWSTEERFCPLEEPNLEEGDQLKFVFVNGFRMVFVWESPYDSETRFFAVDWKKPLRRKLKDE